MMLRMRERWMTAYELTCCVQLRTPLRQPHLIQQILDKVGMLPQSKTKDKAAPSSTYFLLRLGWCSFQEEMGL
jgi:hypothetical protein